MIQKSFYLANIFLVFLIPLKSVATQDTEFDLWNSWERVGELPFSPRDGVGVIHFKDEIWMLGGWKYGPTTNEIYKSTNGITWQKVGVGAWPTRHCAGMVAFNNRMWVISGDGHSDVWSSEDGINWTEEVNNAPWGKRYSPYVVAYNNKMWLLGGISYWDEEGNYSQNFERPFNDVWSSNDGITWTLECEEAPWGPRGTIHGSVVFKDEMWLMGGGSKNWNVPTVIYNDVWKSKNGVDWELVTERAPWTPRIHVTTTTFDDKIWIIDGTTTEENLTNEVWFSEDGKEWTLQNSLTKFPLTHASTVFVHDSALYIAAGFDIDAIYRYSPPKKQYYEGDTLVTSILTLAPPPLDLVLSSGFTASCFVEDTTIVEIKDGNLVFKKPGQTKLVVYHPGAYGFYPLDSIFIDLEIQKDYLVKIDSLVTGTYGDNSLSIDFSLASGLSPSIYVEDSTTVEYINGELKVKNAGETRLFLISEVSVGSNQLIDTIFVDVVIEKSEQEIVVNSYPHEVILSDTIVIDAYSNAELPIKISPTSYIELVDSLSFLSKSTGKISVQLIQGGNRNYHKDIKELEIYIFQPEQRGAFVFPNPARNYINVFLPENDPGTKVIKLISISGKLLKTFLFEDEGNNLYSLDVSDLVAGTYILHYSAKNYSTSLTIVRND